MSANNLSPFTDHCSLITDHYVHIWKAKLDQPEPVISKMGQTLSDDELSRAKKFYFKRDSDKFIVSHGILRHILGDYLNKEPSDLTFKYGIRGKPYLMDDEICFNMSHSGDIAVYAFARNPEIGVDVERIRNFPEADDIFSRFFSPYENKVFKSLPDEQKQEAFFRCWTLKEAYIKALGDGLAHPLDQFDVSFAPGEPAGLLNEESSKWLLKDFVPAPGYMAAVALEKKEDIDPMALT